MTDANKEESRSGQNVFWPLLFLRLRSDLPVVHGKGLIGMQPAGHDGGGRDERLPADAAISACWRYSSSSENTSSSIRMGSWPVSFCICSALAILSASAGRALLPLRAEDARVLAIDVQDQIVPVRPAERRHAP